MSRSSPEHRPGRWPALLLLAVLTGCGSRTITTSGRQIVLPAGEVAPPVHSVLERRFETVVRQRYDFSCGSAALATLMRYHYAKPTSEEFVFLGMWRTGDQARIRQLGFSLLDMKRFLASHGIAADGFQVTLDDIAQTRIPGIALITTRGYKHFVVVKGVEGDRVLVGDPARGLRLLTTNEFKREWNGILFALDNSADLGKSNFGRPAEWALAPRSPLSRIRAMEPLSLQELSLVRATPFPIEL